MFNVLWHLVQLGGSKHRAPACPDEFHTTSTQRTIAAALWTELWSPTSLFSSLSTNFGSSPMYILVVALSSLVQLYNFHLTISNASGICTEHVQQCHIPH